MAQYFLHIERFTQNRFSGDPETPVAAEQIDHEKNLHVYLTGNIPIDRSVQLRAVRRDLQHSGKETTSDAQVTQSVTAYKASLPHYTLSATASYLLKAIDDDRDPFAMASHDIRTI
jgi:hypothetical protein